jgi:hypothetical protein
MALGYHGNSSWQERDREDAKGGSFFLLFLDQLSSCEEEGGSEKEGPNRGEACRAKLTFRTLR